MIDRWMIAGAVVVTLSLILCFWIWTMDRPRKRGR